MSILSALGLAAGDFLFAPKGMLGLAIVLAVARFNPLLGVTLFGAVLLLERWL